MLRRRAAAEALEVVEGTCAWAEPAGTLARAAYEELRDRILAELEAALPVDAVVLGLHGAMVAHGYDDCEGDILARVRRRVGQRVPIGAELDPHCHLTDRMVDAADLLVCYKEFPHTDFVERAEEVVDLTLRTARGEIRPRMSLFDCRMIASFPTSSRADAKLRRRHQGAARARTASCRSRSRTASRSATCRAWAPRCWWSPTAMPSSARCWPRSWASGCSRMRGQTAPPFLGIDEGIDRALAIEGGPVVIADPSDNPGGGAPGDATAILRALIERGVRDAAIGPIWDPIAVQFCIAAGEGARLALRFAGKTGPASGQPVDAEVEIRRVVRDATQTFGQSVVDMGDCAAVRIGGLDIVLTTRRRQAFGTDLFGNLGIDLAAKKIVVVKSTNHFYASFAPIAKEVLYVDSGGPLPRDLRTLPFRRIERPKWPFDEQPFAQPNV